MKTSSRRTQREKGEEGVVVIIIALALVMLLAFSALAIDVGHLMVVRNELQNAADAAALAGASYFYPQAPVISATAPDWSAATSHAASGIGLNRSDGAMLSNCQVNIGYWNYSHTPFGLQSTGIPPGPQDLPAVQVTVRRSSGNNGGPVQNWVAPIIGLGTSEVAATAIAVMASPGNAMEGALLPVAIGKEVADQAGSYNSPSTPFRIGSSYHYPTNEAGQWTSFEIDSNNVPTIRDLIANGNPTSLGIGDDIWIQPGTKNTLYSSIPVGTTVLLPVVQSISTHAYVPIIGFIGFHITASVGGSGKYIEGYFVTGCYAGKTNGVGPNYGAFAPPTLVQ